MLDQQQIRTLAKYEAPACVSIVLPTQRKSRETRENPIRFKNLLAQAEERLIAEGMRPAEARQLLEAGQQMVDDHDFWQHQSDGLAVFIAPGHLIRLRLPATVPEDVRVDVRFHIRHLVPLLSAGDRFFILGLSQDSANLYACTRLDIERLEAPHLPPSMQAEAERTDYQEKTSFHPTGPTPTTHGVPTAKVHAGGESPEDVRENQMRRWLQKVAAGLGAELATETAPLVVAADERLFGHLMPAIGYRHVLQAGITEHPEALSEAALHDKALALVRPVLDQGLTDARERFAALHGAGSSQATTDSLAALQAAMEGRVEVLFIGRDGTPDQAGGSDGAEEGGSDAGGADTVDRAAAEALLTGARIFALPRAKMPDEAAIAAILRY